MPQKISRIELEFILKSLKERRASVELQLDGGRLPAVVESFNDEQIRFEILADEAPKTHEDQPIEMLFQFRGQTFSGKSKIVKPVETGVVARQPRAVHRDLARRFPRILAPRGIGVYFVIDEQAISLSFPDSEQYAPVQKPSFDPGFDASKLTDLLQAFRERALQYAAESKIVMLRDRKPKGMFERLIVHTGRILILPFPVEQSQAVPPEAVANLITRHRVETLEREMAEQFSGALQVLTDASNEMRRKKLMYELYCPILYYQYVVGYLYLVRPITHGAEFDSGVIDFVWQYARVFAYSLEANGYFRSSETRPELRKAELIDLSANGALFSVPKDGPSLGMYAETRLELRLDRRRASVQARVVRRIEEGERIFLGLQFTKISPELQRALCRRLYGIDSPEEAEEFSGIELEDLESPGSSSPRGARG